jgi:hypothetical protein
MTPRLQSTRRAVFTNAQSSAETRQRANGWDQTACKPGSVPPACEHANATIIPLDRPLPDGARDLPGRLGRRRPAGLLDRRDAPIWSCSRRGLPCRPGYPVRGGLLPHPFTLTPLRRKALKGGLLSVALSLGSPPAGVTRRLAAVEPGLSSLRGGWRRFGGRPPGRLIRPHSGWNARPGQGDYCARGRTRMVAIMPPSSCSRIWQW